MVVGPGFGPSQVSMAFGPVWAPRGGEGDFKAPPFGAHQRGG